MCVCVCYPKYNMLHKILRFVPSKQFNAIINRKQQKLWMRKHLQDGHIQYDISLLIDFYKNFR